MSVNSVTPPDLEYLQILREVKPYITCIINVHYIGLIKLWLERLSEDFPDKRLRNVYLHRLCKQIEDGVLEYPFTDPPPDGDLHFADDDNDVFLASSINLAQNMQPLVLKNGQGDSRVIETSPPPEEDNSWVDISDYSSVITSDEKYEQQAKHLEQLRIENKDLKKLMAKNDNYIELNQDLTNKVIELQKQLAKAMLRNVELQKMMQTMEEQRDRQLKKTAEQHKLEIEALKEQYLDMYDERERKLKHDVDVKCSDFTKKYKSLQDWYQNKLVEHEAVLEETSVSYQKKIQELQTKLDESEQKNQEIRTENAIQLEQLDKRTTELRELLDEERKESLYKHDSCVKELEIKIVEQDIEYRKQQEQVQKLKDMVDSQAAHFRQNIEDETARQEQSSNEQAMRHERELKQLRDEHAKILEEQLTIHIQEMAQQAQQAQKAKDQQRAAEKHCASLVKQCDHFRAKNSDLNQQVNILQRDAENQRAEQKKQLLEYRKNAKEENTTLQSQILIHQQQIDDLQNMHKEQINIMETKHQNEIAALETLNREKLEDEQIKCHMQMTDLKSAYDQEVQKKLKAQRDDMGEQTKILQENMTKIATSHQQVIEDMKQTHLIEIQELRTSFDKMIEEKSAVHRKCIEERHGEQHKLINKLQLQMLFDNHRQVVESQRDNLKVEGVLKDECAKLCADVQKYRMEKARSDGEVGRLSDIVQHLRNIIAKMNTMHNSKEKELYKKVAWLQEHFQKYKLIQTNKHGSCTHHDHITKLEAKYKRILLDLQKSAKEERDRYMKKINDLESKLGFRMLKGDK